MSLNEAQLKEVFSDNLKYFMASNGTSEPTLSEETGISQSAINRLKNGSVAPTLYQALMIANFFHITIEKLLVKNKPERIKNKDSYIPILDSYSFLTKQEKKIIGFSKSDVSEAIGFKQDRCFTQKILGKGSIIIVRKLLEPKPQDGSTLLYAHNSSLKIGNFVNGKIHPIDNLLTLIDIGQVTIIGKVCLMELNYIRDDTMIEKIINSIGKINLRKQIDLLLPA